MKPLTGAPIIRAYQDSDELGWVRCRLLSFLDSSYRDDVRDSKETYEHPSICFVAEDAGQIAGLIDIEYETVPGEVCYRKGTLGATIWHLGVMPEYRRQHVATQLWQRAKEALIEKGIARFEVWTQDDVSANRWYEAQGFLLKESYLNAFLKGGPKDAHIQKYIRLDEIGEIYGVRCFNFEAPLERKAELQEICYRLHEVRLYELQL